ncbi:head-tail adaptor protein [uncultured Enterococcus sp.]|uniref:phage head completion protein n=1 Tax=uncultured Enterococcus sp. TaxID=167972 RepID=UPI002AA611C5|nr:head-tail adaptor protein [uncultured Enterococcus sp.]
MGVSRTGKLKHRVSFKKRNGFITGPNGIKIPNNVERFKTWFAYKQKFISEVKTEDSAYIDTIDIIIRQQQKETIDPDWIVVIKEKEYHIVKINPDLTNQEFMVLVLKAVE